MLRTDLIDKLALVNPALSSNPLIPILQCFWFTGRDLIAYNDQIAISTPLQTSFVGAVSGDILLSLLKASKAKDIELIAENENLLIKAATARFRLKVLPPESFVFEMPEQKAGFTNSDSFYLGVESCMRSVSNDTSIPDQLGITLIPEDGRLRLFSTNNFTISSAVVELKSKITERIILSESFCKQMLSLNKKGSKLEITKDYALFIAGETKLFGRLIESAQPIDFIKVIDHHLPNGFEKKLISIPSKLQLILERAIIITDSTLAEKNPMAISVKERGRMTFNSKSEDRGEVSDYLTIEKMQPEIAIKVDPKLIKIGYGFFDRWIATENAIIMTKTDNSFIYLIGVTKP